MSNHVHVVAFRAVPRPCREAFHRVHGRYAAYWNVAHTGSGHVWQGRFYSCPMEAGHLWTALRYTELNPVRAGLVARPPSGRGRAPPRLAERGLPTNA